MPTSSMITNGTFTSVCNFPFFNLYLLLALSSRCGLISLGYTLSIHNQKNEWAVCHHMLTADIQVDHKTNGGLPIVVQKSTTSLISVDFPVPAFHVRNIQWSVSSNNFKKHKASGLSFRLSRSTLYWYLNPPGKFLIFSIWKTSRIKIRDICGATSISFP